MDKSRITAAIWPWGTSTREQMEIAAKEIHDIGYVSFESVKSAIYAYDLNVKDYKEVCNKNEIWPVSFYFHLRFREEEDQIFANIDKELEFCAELGLKRICLQATSGRPYQDDVERMDKCDMDYELDLIGKFAEKTKEFGIMSNLHPHHNTWVMYENEIDNILQNLDSSIIQFAPDTAHLTAANADPVKVIEKYKERVNFTHLKDIKSFEVKSVGFSNAGVEVYSNFCELGKGNVDFANVFKILKSVNYDGPLCEELDKAPNSNAESAANNYKYILENY